MVGFKCFFTKKTLIGLFLGQILSLFITLTGFSSSELARRGINAPTSLSLANYMLLAIFYGGILIRGRNGMKVKWYFYLLLGISDVEANYLVVKAYQYTSLTSVMLLDCWSYPMCHNPHMVLLEDKISVQENCGCCNLCSWYCTHYFFRCTCIGSFTERYQPY
ncbi:hypothetical protein R6Q59_030569 [Mikania micrantha]